MIGVVLRRRERVVDRQRRPARQDGGLVVRRRPAPKRQRRVALEVGDHAFVLQDGPRHHAERFAHPGQHGVQVVARLLDFLREPAHVAEQHAHRPFAAAPASRRRGDPTSVSTTAGEKNCRISLCSCSSTRTCRTAPMNCAISSASRKFAEQIARRLDVLEPR